MMPMGIERCGFLASSPVQRQEAVSVSTPWHSWPHRTSHNRDFPRLWGWAEAVRG